MKQYLLFICMTGLLFAAAPHHAEAQFLKQLFQKEKTKKKPAKKITTTPRQHPKPAKKDQRIDYPPTVLKKRYRVDILVPLYLDEFVRNNKTTFRDKIPAKALPGISFYEGVKLAADTMDPGRYRMDIYVHDISSGSAVEQLLARKTFDSSDLLIGVVQSAEIAPLALFAKKNQINFISVLSPSDGGIQQNPYFTLLQPTLHTHCDWMRNTIRKKFPGQQTIIYRRDAVPVDETAFRFVSENQTDDMVISCNSLPDRKTLLRAFDSTETNVIIMPILDISYAESLLAQLRDGFPEYRFEIFGMPSWNAIPSLKKSAANTNMAVSFTTPYYFDPTTSSGQILSDRYGQTFGGVPGEWVYRGYETFYWYASLLRKWGTIFNPKISDNSGATFTKYEVAPTWDTNGDLLYFENRHLYMYRYEGGSYMIEP